MAALIQDVRYALRSIVQARGFAALALTMLALGVSANAAVFTIVDSVLLRPLPFREASRLVRVTSDYARLGAPDAGVSVPELWAYRDRTDLFESVSGLYPVNANLTGVDEPERIEGEFVSASYFSLLGIDAALGRVFGPADDQAGIGTVTVISDSLWRRRFGADPNVISRVARLDGDPITIVGVLGPGFHHPGRGIEGEPEFFQPVGYTGGSFGSPPPRGVRMLRGVLARLAPGVTIAAARERLAAAGAAFRSQYQGDYPSEQGWAPRLIPLQEDLVGHTRSALLLLLGAVAAVLLIASANVANLLLARSTVRQREFAVRRALGGTRGRLIRQLLTESAVLALGAGFIGVLAALWWLAAFSSLVPAELAHVASLTVDARVLAFSLALSLLTAAVFGVWPALHAAAATDYEALKDGGRTATAGRRTTDARGALVVAEVAIALALAVTATLLVRSFVQLYHVDPGFDSTRLLTARSWMPFPNDAATGPYFEHDARLRFYRRTLEALQAIPGVERAAWVGRLPLGSQRRSSGVLIEGRPPGSAIQNVVEPLLASPAYFDTMGIRLIRGRGFSDADDVKSPPVLIVSESLARQYFPNEDVIGRRVRPGGPGSTAPWHMIVGVVADVRSMSLDVEPHAQMYRCLWQRSDLAMSLVVRAADGDPKMLANAVRLAVRQIDPDLPLYAVRTMDEVLATSLARQRFAMIVTGVFAILALTLSAVGTYSVLAYLVHQRTGEIGMRMALGATPGSVLRLIFSEGFGLVAIGITIGLGASVLVARAISSLLFGIGPFDPISFIGVAAVLAVVAALACILPAWRAMRIDPLRALRHS
jgi:predicted permease